MNEKLEKVVEKLKANNIEFKIIKLERSGITSKDVEKLTGWELENIYKTIVLTNEKNFFAVLVPGSKRVDLEKVEKIFGKGLRLAKAKELKEKLKLAPGEVCPFLIDIPFVADKSILSKGKIHLGSGDIKYDLEIEATDILKLTNAKIDSISD